MQLPDNYILIQKEVKHARLRVSEDGRIRVIIPQAFSQEDVEALISCLAYHAEQNSKEYYYEVRSWDRAESYPRLSAVERAGLTGLNDNQKIQYELQSGRDGRASASDLQLL